MISRRSLMISSGASLIVFAMPVFASPNPQDLIGAWRCEAWAMGRDFEAAEGRVLFMADGKYEWELGDAIPALRRKDKGRWTYDQSSDDLRFKSNRMLQGIFAAKDFSDIEGGAAFEKDQPDRVTLKIARVYDTQFYSPLQLRLEREM